MKLIKLEKSESYALEMVLPRLAKWIKAHHEKYAPLTAVSRVPEYRGSLQYLRRKGYIRFYKSGEVLVVEKKGWEYMSMNFPWIAARR
ncbi:MAG: hypothetical protein HXS52_03785 [Theionarchaea archaeon]|nr:hypothetical protein [Theionarchaea archaeon]